MQYSSHGVREQTAEIASWALSDAGSVRSGSSPQRPHASARWPSEATEIGSSIGATSEEDVRTPRDSNDSSRPAPIEEISEPVSPQSVRSSYHLPRESALAQLIRNSPPQEIGGFSEEAIEDEVDNSLPATPSNDRSILQVNEQTSLLGKNNQHTANTIHDIEGQTLGRNESYPSLARALGWPKKFVPHRIRTVINPKAWTAKDIWKRGLIESARCVPAVILGLLLNILDALSYGQ